MVIYTGYRLRILARDATGAILTKKQDSTGAFPQAWDQVTGLSAAGSPSALLDPVTGKTEVIARGSDGAVYSTGSPTGMQSTVAHITSSAVRQRTLARSRAAMATEPGGRQAPVNGVAAGPARGARTGPGAHPLPTRRSRPGIWRRSAPRRPRCRARRPARAVGRDGGVGRGAGRGPRAGCGTGRVPARRARPAAGRPRE